MFDFKAIPVHLKNMMIHVWILPFWYIALYLFSPTIYNKQEIILTCCICISLTLVSAITSTTLSGAIVDKKNELHIFDLPNVLAGFVIQIALLSILIILGYLFSLITDYIFRFYGFVITYFTFLLLLFFIISKLEKNSENK